MKIGSKDRDRVCENMLNQIFHLIYINKNFVQYFKISLTIDLYYHFLGLLVAVHFGDKEILYGKMGREELGKIGQIYDLGKKRMTFDYLIIV